MQKVKENTLGWLEENSDILRKMAKNIWKKPEVGLKEDYASNLQASQLDEAGFDIQKDIGEIDTAFISEYGTEGPLIGILGEYDALPGLSQKVKDQRDPVVEGDPGHGCGHNLLGTAGVGAVLGIKEMIRQEELQGRKNRKQGRSLTS